LSGIRALLFALCGALVLLACLDWTSFLATIADAWTPPSR
jgi:hypothetical protein